MTRAIIVCSEALDEMMMIAPESCVGRHRADSLSKLRAVLEALSSADDEHSLDLIGHSSRDAKLLRLGKTLIDVADVRVAQFFERLAREHFGRLRIRAVRLLGCETAVEVLGQRTMHGLARIVGVNVYGSRKSIFKTHYNRDGFDPEFANLALIESRQLPNPPRRLA